ncbi:gp53-like domain-containing protein [Kluyvera sp. CHPC 1.251]|uniref:gp53-like domain-containing protein n=1 Tax=Kluyvera sp. CHPC 1.251 TaxID=2995175 RepID=UPI002FD7D333
MNRSDAPTKQSNPFGVNGQREPILATTPAGDNTASYDQGFPPITMILKSAGGLPPKGQDMNQILFELSSLARWSSTGALNGYDHAFSSAIGGYPKGSLVAGSDGVTIFQSTVDNNNVDPNSDSTGWINFTSAYLRVANNLSEIAGVGSVAQQAARSNLNLGNSSTRDVGTGANQIPDMSSFTASLAANGYAMLPNGYIIQQANTTASLSETDYRNFPIPFPNVCFQIVACYGEFSSFGYGCAALPTSKSQFVVSARSSTGTLTNAPVRIIAIGN